MEITSSDITYPRAEVVQDHSFRDPGCGKMWHFALAIISASNGSHVALSRHAPAEVVVILSRNTERLCTIV